MSNNNLKSRYFLVQFFIILVAIIIVICITNYTQLNRAVYLLILLNITAYTILLLWIYNTYIKPLKSIKSLIENDDLELQQYQYSKKSYLFELEKKIIELKTNKNEAIAFAEIIGNGDFQKSFVFQNPQNDLAQMLVTMRQKLKLANEEETKRNWAIDGYAKFDQIFRENLNSNLDVLGRILVSNLVKYVNANQCGIFVIQENDNQPSFISLLASYAFSKNQQKEQIDLDEGLVGECIRTKEVIFIDNLPETYLTIESGLGVTAPKCVLIVPTVINNTALGAIEIASLNTFEPYQIDFIKKIATNFAYTYQYLKSSATMSHLFEISKKNAEELTVKEKILLENEIELKNAQETLNQNLIELLAETNLTKSILDAINKSNACIHFDTHGNILDANDVFLSVMQFEKHEIVGKNESIFIPQDEIDSEIHKMMWQSLREGNFNSGEFKRINKHGKEIWMDVTFNPIYSLDKRVFKILMFASFTTDQKEKEKEYLNKLQALNESVGLLELNLDYTVKSANPFFLNKLNIKRKDLKSYTFIDMISNPNNASQVIDKIKNFPETKVPIIEDLHIHLGTHPPMFFNITISAGLDLSNKVSCYYAILILKNDSLYLQ